MNIRLISATNADITKAISNGSFREDLYYRLNVIPINLPNLSERRGDIPLLARHFLEKICAEMNRPLMHISKESLQALESYHWPGNVREMENVIERTVALADGETIEPEDLPPNIVEIESIQPIPSIQLPEGGADMPTVIAEIERQMIGLAMSRATGVKARAADLLGINRTTLVEKMKRLGL
jgi:DNA-binding NtrC family response regulator